MLRNKYHERIGFEVSPVRERRTLCVSHIAPYFVYIFIYLIRVQTAHVDGLLSSMCAAAQAYYGRRLLRCRLAGGTGEDGGGGAVCRSAGRRGSSTAVPLSASKWTVGQASAANYKGQATAAFLLDVATGFYVFFVVFFYDFCLKFNWVTDLKEHAPTNKNHSHLDFCSFNCRQIETE